MGGQEHVSDRIKITPPPSGWCSWCRDRPSAGLLILVDDTGVPLGNPTASCSAESGLHPMCRRCGATFHGSRSRLASGGTYIYDAEDL